MQDLKVSRSTTYIRLHQNHTCRTKYRKPRRVWGSLRLWWPLAFAIWQVFQEAYVTLEALALGSGMEADGSHVTCYLGWGLGIIIRAWRGRGFKNPPLITAPVWHISRIIFWVEGFRCQCHATKTLKKGIRPNNIFDTRLLVRNRCGCGFFGSGRYQIDWRGSQWPHWSVGSIFVHDQWMVITSWTSAELVFYDRLRYELAVLEWFWKLRSIVSNWGLSLYI